MDKYAIIIIALISAFALNFELQAQIKDSTSDKIDRLITEMYRGHSTELSHSDSSILIEFKNKVNEYKRNENYLAVHSEAIEYIIKENSYPLCLEIAKILIVDDPYVIEYIFKNIDIEKGRPKVEDSNKLTANIFIEAFNSSYGRRSIFVKHLIFQKLLDDCNIVDIIRLSAPWSYNKKETISFLQYASYVFKEDELFLAVLECQIENQNISDCKRKNLVELKQHILDN